MTSNEPSYCNVGNTIEWTIPKFTGPFMALFWKKHITLYCTWMGPEMSSLVLVLWDSLLATYWKSWSFFVFFVKFDLHFGLKFFSVRSSVFDRFCYRFLSGFIGFAIFDRFFTVFECTCFKKLKKKHETNLVFFRCLSVSTSVFFAFSWWTNSFTQD